MFFNYGDNWRVVRQSVTPLFSGAKMKNMFGLIKKCTVDFENLLEYETGLSNTFETNLLMSRFTLDCTGSCTFGIEMNLLQQGYEDNPYKKMGDAILGQSDLRGYLNIFRSIWPRIFYILGLTLYPKDLNESLVGLITNICNLRNNKPSPRNDFIDLLLSLKSNEFMIGDSLKKTSDGESKMIYRKLDNEILAALCMAFFGGGYETSATTLTMTLFEIAKNKEIQFKVQEEVDNYLFKHNNELDYDCLTELPYLAACIEESLRLHPLFTVITREVMEDYTFPTGLKLEKGVRIHVPVYHIHLNPENFPQPELYRPERFLPEERHKIKPFTYLPFGEGLRICIGMRFGKMEVIAGLITIFKNYQVQLAEGMSTTVEFDPRLLVSHPTDGVFIDFKRRQ